DAVAAGDRDGGARGGGAFAVVTGEHRIIGSDLRFGRRYQGIDRLAAGGGGQHVAGAAGAGDEFGGIDVAAAAGVDHRPRLRGDIGGENTDRLGRRRGERPRDTIPGGAVGGV